MLASSRWLVHLRRRPVLCAASNLIGRNHLTLSRTPARWLSKQASINGSTGQQSGGSSGRARAASSEDRSSDYSLGAGMLAIALGAIGLSYASVPLYRIFCQVRLNPTGESAKESRACGMWRCAGDWLRRGSENPRRSKLEEESGRWRRRR